MAYHAYCCRHLYMNIKAKDASVECNKKIFWKTYRAYTTYEFDLICLPYELQYLALNCWIGSTQTGLRYNIMTSNSVECMNAHSRFARKGAIVGLMEYFRAFQQEWYSKRRELAGYYIGIIFYNSVEKKIFNTNKIITFLCSTPTNILTPWVEVRVQKRAAESASWIVRDIGYCEYEVQDGYRDAKVQYYDKSCSCKRWQLSGLPCGHACWES
ncbi:hypothetical protein OSB04_un000891 [Centaurea solstitialis]|uniref:SWIM-type domain-containing protein n=1 Tax=Centaurea solstitialis TaxID=347529 RepID=A0AA38S477_9ASTR|nr:hypothetical protein OSB04_un000891 [Centaurea solstitialis]